MLLVHSGRFREWRWEREWKAMELNVSVHSVFCFTLLFECALQGNVVDRWLVKGVHCRLGSGCLTGRGADF